MDLEMTKLCAEAMGIEWCAEPKDGTSGLACYLDPSMKSRDMNTRIYDPLHDDAQAMALVKKFKLNCTWHAQPPDEVWEVTTPYAPVRGASTDLNRAIVQCAAKIA